VEERKQKAREEMQKLEAQIHDAVANEFVRGLDLSVRTQLKDVTVVGIKAKHIDVTKVFKNAEASVSLKNMEIFDGSLASDLRTDLKRQPLSYDGTAKIRKLNLGSAVKSILVKFKDTLSGLVST